MIYINALAVAICIFNIGYELASSECNKVLIIIYLAAIIANLPRVMHALFQYTPTLIV